MGGQPARDLRAGEAAVSDVAAKRPAEKAGAGGVGVLATAAALGAGRTVVLVLGLVAGALPACVTYLLVHGGIRGVVRSLWRGGAR